MHFSDLGLIDPLLKALQDVGYQTPSPIQKKAIPPVLQRRDILGCAQTGTGKTAAFALPLLQLLEQKPAPKGGRPIRLLVLTPTRELAAQIQECFVNYGKYLNHRSVVVFGGVGQQPQIDALHKGADILVATPGRLLDLCGQGHISLKELEFFVLDEADRMLDMGFIHDIRRVIKLLPAQRQTLFFSATMPEEIRKLAAGLLTNPVQVAVDPVSSTVEVIEQKVLFTDKAKKRDLLLHLLEDGAVTSALVFSRTKHLADRLAKFLKKNGVAADSIHGDKSQGARLRALGDFKSGKCRVLVATDIAARGIDVSGISHVFNFDLPDLPETYVHRIGRTGRAGQGGTALSFCTADEVEALRSIEKLIGKRITVVENHPYPASQPIPEPPKPQPKGKKKPDKNRQNLQKALKKVEEVQQKKEKTGQPQINFEAFQNKAGTQPPLSGGVFSSEVKLPGRVAARSGSLPKKEKPISAAQPKPAPKTGDSQPAPKKKEKKKGAQPPQSRSGKKGRKDVFLQPEENRQPVGTSSRSRRRREPVWIPINDQPIVTRPQSYFIEMPKAEPQPEAKPQKKKKRRRKKPSQKSNLSGGTQ